ncbi:hypothetical protein LCGC14_2499330, partial [marine sediment metagenome]
KFISICIECQEELTIEFTVDQYEELSKYVLCNKNPDHITRETERIYTPTRVEFRGEGFTGAGGVHAKMDKAKRKKDLSENSGVEI